MTTLTQQFLVVLLLPLAVLGIFVYFLRTRLKRKVLVGKWSLVLLVSAVWVSSLLRFYLGVGIPSFVPFSWGVLGRYALTGTTLAILWTTFSHLNTIRNQRLLTMGLGVALAVTAVMLDPIIWQRDITLIRLAGETTNTYNLWVGFWVASWFVPLVGAWVLTRKASNRLPTSQYRNQIQYWLLFLVLFAIGGGFGSIQGSASWQGVSGLIIIPGLLLATVSLVRTPLPDLQLVIRQALSRLSGTLIIFGLTWLILWFINQVTAEMETGQNFILVIAASLFAVVFTLIYRGVNALTKRIFLPTLSVRDIVMSDYLNTIGNLPEPKALALLFLRILQTHLTTNDGWFFTVEDGPHGQLVLRGLEFVGEKRVPTAVDFANDNPFTQRLRTNSEPLSLYDINTLPIYDEMPPEKKELIQSWERLLFVPLRAGESLVGVVALGEKYTGEPYDRADFAQLQALANQTSALLAQAQNIASLYRINNYVFAQNQELAREKHHWQALATLYMRFIRTVSPDIRQPFTQIDTQLFSLQQNVVDAKPKQAVAQLSTYVDKTKESLDHVIALAGRMQQREMFRFAPVALDALAKEAMRNLSMMADARRLNVNLIRETSIALVMGDAEQLTEAIQHLLHNAIKFNKIGGTIDVKCGVNGDECYVLISDTGVGIPVDRLESVWQGQWEVRKNGKRPLRHGSGLGLTLTQFIVSAHNGRVSAVSEYGAGSQFGLYIPVTFDD